MNAQRVKMVRNHCHCAKHQRQKFWEAMTICNAPSRAWQQLAIDVFEHGGNHHLLIIDYYSCSFETNKSKQHIPQHSSESHQRSSHKTLYLWWAYLRQRVATHIGGIFKVFKVPGLQMQLVVLITDSFMGWSTQLIAKKILMQTRSSLRFTDIPLWNRILYWLRC